MSDVMQEGLGHQSAERSWESGSQTRLYTALSGVISRIGWSKIGGSQGSGLYQGHILNPGS